MNIRKSTHHISNQVTTRADAGQEGSYELIVNNKNVSQSPAPYYHVKVQPSQYNDHYKITFFILYPIHTCELKLDHEILVF